MYLPLMSPSALIQVGQALSHVKVAKKNRTFCYMHLCGKSLQGAVKTISKSLDRTPTKYSFLALFHEALALKLGTCLLSARLMLFSNETFLHFCGVFLPVIVRYAGNYEKRSPNHKKKNKTGTFSCLPIAEPTSTGAN